MPRGGPLPRHLAPAPAGRRPDRHSRCNSQIATVLNGRPAGMRAYWQNGCRQLPAAASVRNPPALPLPSLCPPGRARTPGPQTIRKGKPAAQLDRRTCSRPVTLVASLTALVSPAVMSPRAMYSGFCCIVSGKGAVATAPQRTPKGMRRQSVRASTTPLHRQAAVAQPKLMPRLLTHGFAIRPGLQVLAPQQRHAGSPPLPFWVWDDHADIEGRAPSRRS